MRRHLGLVVAGVAALAVAGLIGLWGLSLQSVPVLIIVIAGTVVGFVFGLAAHEIDRTI